MNFRMTLLTLEEVADTLHPRLECLDTNMRQAIPVFKCVAMTVWWLANVASFRLLREQFVAGPSTAAEVVIKVYLAMKMELLHRTVYLGKVGIFFF